MDSRVVSANTIVFYWNCYKELHVCIVEL